MAGPSFLVTRRHCLAVRRVEASFRPSALLPWKSNALRGSGIVHPPAVFIKWVVFILQNEVCLAS